MDDRTFGPVKNEKSLFRSNYQLRRASRMVNGMSSEDKYGITSHPHFSTFSHCYRLYISLFFCSLDKKPNTL
ncbi:hypothetical protein E4U15_003593 [Claviceps sp. LM218 group G6]|nr:hypothetical protein E4U15_003593 [Claviceps sp. LM218 group G6]